MSDIGSLENPIIPTPEVSSPTKDFNDVYSRRGQLLDETKFGVLEQNFEDVNRASDESTYILNVISNPYLDTNAVKIALYFYTALSERGDIFGVSQPEPDGINWENYGEDGVLYVKSRDGYTDMEDYLMKDISFLSTVLFEKLNIAPSFPRLTGYLRQLHGFSYITVTDINIHNTKSGLISLRKDLKDKAKTAEKCKSLTLGRSPLKHIRISKYMRKANISDRWVWANEKKS